VSDHSSLDQVSINNSRGIICARCPRLYHSSLEEEGGGGEEVRLYTRDLIKPFANG